MSDEIRIACGVVVNPGDRLVIGVQSAHISRDEVVGLRLALQEQLPDVTVIVVTGVGEMAVLPAEGTPAPQELLRAAEQRIEVLEQELNENGAHFDATLQELREELRTANAKVELLQHQLADTRGRQGVAAEGNIKQLEAQLEATEVREIRFQKDRTAARTQRDRLILAIRTHLNGNCGRNTAHLHDAVDLVEHEIGAGR